MTMPELAWSEELGRRVRTGDWQDQATSTVTKITQAVQHGRVNDAAELVEYFTEEAAVVQNIYTVWFPRFREWLGQQGVAAAEIDAELDRLATLLALPDGRRFDPYALWEEVNERAGRLVAGMRSGSVATDALLDDLDGLREDWRRVHDRWADLLSGVLTFVAHRFGEDALEGCYRHVLEPYIDERYMVYDLRRQAYADTLFRNLYTTAEAMRAHLCGPGRRGDIELEEFADHWEFRFDPCGSGGRVLRGDAVEGTGPRTEPPYEFGVTEERHDWAWNEEGVCYYCAHCCFALERLPAERWGHPVRVVDPPLYQGTGAAPKPNRCQWTVYKTVEAIPAAAYERIGMAKPGLGAGDDDSTTQAP
jgi:hypothetical protein